MSLLDHLIVSKINEEEMQEVTFEAGQPSEMMPMAVGIGNHTVEPRKGRLVMFTSGNENIHRVRKVLSGTRLVMSMWFTCNPNMHFHNFLDGKAHRRYSQKAKESKKKKKKKKKKRRRKYKMEGSHDGL